MKKLLPVIIITLLLVVLTACGGSDNSKNDTQNIPKPNLPSSVTSSSGGGFIASTPDTGNESSDLGFELGLESAIEFPEDVFE